MVRLLKRLPYSENWFAGVEFVYLNTETIFDLGIASPALPETAGQITNAGLGPVLSYDSRDDNYYPTRGQNLEMLLLSYRDNWGGDLDYRKLDLNVSHFQLLVPKLVLALHADYKASEGDVPFFDLPSLEMRGFPVGRYRDQYTFSTHAEGRYKFLPRWGGNLFVESGWYGDEPEELFAGETVVSYGGGVRWQVTADEKIHLGLLMAFSGGDKGFYITVGEKF
jgi:outer membrane protein assembly factor BamA